MTAVPVPPAYLPGFVSRDNCTSTALGAGETFTVKVFSAVSNAIYRVATLYLDGDIENNFSFDPVHPLQVGEKSAIWIEATVSVDNTSVAGRMVLTTYQDPGA